ncbi:MAG: hypothetical protein ACRDA5_14295 [Clostridium sp.]
MNKNLHLKVGIGKILAITVLTLTILGGCSSTTKNDLVLPIVADESTNSIVPQGDLRASYSEEIVSKVYSSDNKYYDFASKLTVPFLEKLDSIDKLSSDIPYFENSKGNAFTQAYNSKLKSLTYVRILPNNISNSLRELSFSLGIDEGQKPLLGQSSFKLTLIDNNNSGNVLLSDKEKSILNIIYPNINLDEVQSNLSTVFEEKLTNNDNLPSSKGKFQINLDDNTMLSTVAYKNDGSENIIVELSIIQTSTYKK